MAFDREDFDAFWQDWLEINREAQRLGDWGIMADFYEPDATYGYTYSAEDQYMNVGREEIRAGVLGLEMLGFQGWIYPYQAVIFDDRSGQAFGFWRQLTTFNAPDGLARSIVEDHGLIWIVPPLKSQHFQPQYSGANLFAPHVHVLVLS